MAGKHILVEGERFEIYLRERDIQKRIKELAKRINRDYARKVPVALCILNGAFLFYADLLRHLTIDCETAFLPLSSYGSEKTSSGVVRMLGKLPKRFKGRDILVVEDVVDSGNTVEFIENALKNIKVRSYRIISLLYKNDTAKKSVTIRYIGFRIPNHFVIGYGLDHAQKKRNLRDIYRLSDRVAPPQQSHRNKRNNGK